MEFGHEVIIRVHGDYVFFQPRMLTVNALGVSDIRRRDKLGIDIWDEFR